MLLSGPVPSSAAGSRFSHSNSMSTSFYYISERCNSARSASTSGRSLGHQRNTLIQQNSSINIHCPRGFQHQTTPLQVGPSQAAQGSSRWRSRSVQRSVRAHSLAAADDGAHASPSGQEATTFPAFAHAFYKFTRPHTMIGTSISVASISLLALQQSGQVALAQALQGLGIAIVSALLANISIVGLNQLYDIEIDKINKPYLPLASGEFSVSTGIAIVVGSGIASLALSLASGSLPLLATVGVSLVLGILYSTELPFMRWKRSPVLAAGCILVVRALAVQLGFYEHMRFAVGAPAGAPLTPPVLFTVSFMLLFSVVIALFKDIPDAKGDGRAGVRTLTVQLGPTRVFWACIWILTAAYGGAIIYSLIAAASTAGLLGGATAAAGAAALVPALALRTAACVGGHALMAGLLWARARKVNLSKSQEITDCYMYVWKLFYAEYLLIPLLL